MRMFTAIALIAGVSLFSVSCKKKGCTDSTAENYDSDAKKDDGSCVFDQNKVSNNKAQGEWSVTSYLDGGTELIGPGNIESMKITFTKTTSVGGNVSSVFVVQGQTSSDISAYSFSNEGKTCIIDGETYTATFNSATKLTLSGGSGADTQVIVMSK